MEPRTEKERLEQVLIGQSELMFEVHLWLEEEQKKDDLIRALVRSSRKQQVVALHGLDPDRIFSLASIERICTKYRLRFLEGGLFKGDVPAQAVQAVRALERKAEGPLTSFMLMAPAERFKLCDSEVDPLLFVPLGNDRFYLVHKWGGELSQVRAIAYWPVRSLWRLCATVVALAVCFALVVPTSLLGHETTAFFTGQRLLLLFWALMVFGGFTVFGWFAFFGQFSDRAWNSRYFN